MATPCCCVHVRDDVYVRELSAGAGRGPVGVKDDSKISLTDSFDSLAWTSALLIFKYPARAIFKLFFSSPTRVPGSTGGRPLAGVRGQRPRSSETKCGFKNIVYTWKMNKFT
eukprot:364840-Chlamydomonas_euryale.AAC.1